MLIFFCIGNYNDGSDLPTYYDSDIQSRVLTMSKTSQIYGNYFMTAQIEYENYSEDELCFWFDKDFNERILPPVQKGKKYILENLDKLYTLTLHQENVLKNFNRNFLCIFTQYLCK